MKLRRKKQQKKIPIWYWIVGAIVVIIVAAVIIHSFKSPPLKIDDLSYIMPGDSPTEYDVYRVIAVKKDVTRDELVGLMQFFTRIYLDKNRVLIYVFNNPMGAHTGESRYLVARYYQDKINKKYEREITLGQPSTAPPNM